jgi:predicted nucleic acid-binding protein
MRQDLLVDTDVLVDYLRGNDPAVAFMQKNVFRVTFSAITLAELHAGARRTEMAMLDELARLFPVMPVTQEIARAGGRLRAEYGKSHGIGLADALVAATARQYGLLLNTLNVKHFPMFPGLRPPYGK